MKKLAIVFAALMLAACATVGGGSSFSFADLQGKTFALESFNGNSLNIGDAKQPFIEFREGNVTNGQICNTFRGSPSLEGGQIKMLAMSTMMMCISEDLNKAESAFYKAIGEGADISLDAGKLTIGAFVFAQK